MSDVVSSGGGFQESPIPVVAEELEIHKVLEATGIVRITKAVRERTEIADLTAVSSGIHIERVPVNQILESAPDMRHEGETTVYPVVEEVFVVTRKFLLKEEVRVSRLHTSELRLEPVVLRSEELQVHRESPNPDIPNPSPSHEVSFAELAPFAEGEISLTETAERAYAVKRARVVEELVIRKEATERTETVGATVRKTEIMVEQIP